jgi:hypothetical protein
VIRFSVVSIASSLATSAGISDSKCSIVCQMRDLNKITFPLKALKLRIVIKTNASGIFLYFTPILVAKMLGTQSKKEERLSSYHG